MQEFFLLFPFLIFGLFHLMGADKMAGMVPIPGGVFWVYLTGVALLAAAIAIIIKKYGKLACLLLALLLLVFIVTMHIPAMRNAADEADRMPHMIGMLKDIGLMAASLTYAGLFSIEENK